MEEEGLPQPSRHTEGIPTNAGYTVDVPVSQLGMGEGLKHLCPPDSELPPIALDEWLKVHARQFPSIEEGAEGGPTVLFTSLWQSVILLDLYLYFADYLGNNTDFDDMLNRMKGLLYQEIVLALIPSLFPTADGYIDRRDVVELYKAMYPHREKISHPLEMDVIRGVYIPKNLLLQKGMIGAIVDSTMSTVTRLKYWQYISFQVYNSGACLPGTRILFVLPGDQNDTKYTRRFERRLQGSNIDVIVLPFTRKEFNEFFAKFINTYRPNSEDPSLSELLLGER